MTQEVLRTQNELLKSRYQALFLASRDAVMTLEPPSWKFTSGNPATLKMFEVNSEEEFAMHDPWGLSPEFQPDGRKSKDKAEEMIEQAMRDGHNFFEWTHRRVKGEDFPAEVSLSRVDYGEKPFLHAIVRDITERRRVEERLKEYSEEKFKAVFNHANDGMVLADAVTRKFSLSNKAFGAMVGYDSEEIGNLAVLDIHPKEDLPYVLDQFEKQLKGELTVAENIPVKRKDGSIFYADINSSPLTIGDNQFVLGIFRDITDRKQAAELLRESNEKFIAAFQLSPYVSTITRAKDSTFVAVNDAFLAVSGFIKDEVIGRSTVDLNFWVNLEDRNQVLAVISRGGVVKNKEVQLRKKDGEIVTCLYSAQIIHSNGEALVLSSIDDITERRKAEQHICELNEVRDKFIDIISHQLQTPLTVVNWNLESVLKGRFGVLEETTRRFLQATHQASVEITNRIRDLLMAIDIEEGRVVFRKDEVALDSIIASVVNELGLGCEMRGIVCRYSAPEEDFPVIEGDGEKLRTAVVKLIENAIMYTKNGGSVFVKLEKRDGWVRFEVSDRGVGIPVQEQHRVFSRFFRASNASVMQPDAFGLGLYVAKNFIEQHHGKIGFESKEGEGSTFWFEIPMKFSE